jgi:hypothetical protein
MLQDDYGHDNDECIYFSGVKSLMTEQSWTMRIHILPSLSHLGIFAVVPVVPVELPAPLFEAGRGVGVDDDVVGSAESAGKSWACDRTWSDSKSDIGIPMKGSVNDSEQAI